MSKKISPIARNIKRLRKEREFSQDKLSKKADITYHTITKLESGDNDNPTIKTLQKIAAALGVSVDDLITDAEK